MFSLMVTSRKKSTWCNFEANNSQYLICKLKKSIYGLKQTSCQWHLKFDQVISDFSFKKNVVDQCIYDKLKGNKVIFVVLYVGDILLVSNDIVLLQTTKRFLSKNFKMKDLGDASFVINIQIYVTKHVKY